VRAILKVVTKARRV